MCSRGWTFHSIPVCSRGICYSSKSENFPESKVILKFWRLQNREMPHAGGEEILVDPPRLKTSAEDLAILNPLGGEETPSTMLLNCLTSVAMSLCVYRSGNILSTLFLLRLFFCSAPRKVQEASFEALWTSWISKSQRNSAVIVLWLARNQTYLYR